MLLLNSTAKTTPVDADSVQIIDSAASGISKRTTWANIKATLKTYFDGLYLLNAVVNSSASYSDSVTSGFKAVLHDASGAAITHNLPTAVGNTAVITIKKTDSSVNSVTVDANSTETIDGGLTAVLTRQYESITIVSNGTNWVII